MLAVVFPGGLSKFTLCCPCSIISHCLVTGHQAHFPSCHTSQGLALLCSASVLKIQLSAHLLQEAFPESHP